MRLAEKDLSIWVILTNQNIVLTDHMMVLTDKSMILTDENIVLTNVIIVLTTVRILLLRFAYYYYVLPITTTFSSVRIFY